MKTILVIEDEPEMLRNMVTILQMEGFKTFAAKDGNIGVAVGKRELPDLVLCDVMMPELDGYGVLAAFRADPVTVGLLFIFLTARGEKSDVRSDMNLGADDYHVSPRLPVFFYRFSNCTVRVKATELNDRIVFGTRPSADSSTAFRAQDESSKPASKRSNFHLPQACNRRRFHLESLAQSRWKLRRQITSVRAVRK